MTHVFVAPHSDDVALSCGGLIASLRELGQNVTIITVFSGNGANDGLAPYHSALDLPIARLLTDQDATSLPAAIAAAP